MENLGKKAKDQITGFEGIIIGKCHYLTGCDQYGIAPPAFDNKVANTEWFDVNRVLITGPAAEKIDAENNPGGPNRDHP